MSSLNLDDPSAKINTTSLHYINLKSFSAIKSELQLNNIEALLLPQISSRLKNTRLSAQNLGKYTTTSFENISASISGDASKRKTSAALHRASQKNLVFRQFGRWSGKKSLLISCATKIDMADQIINHKKFSVLSKQLGAGVDETLLWIRILFALQKTRIINDGQSWSCIDDQYFSHLLGDHKHVQRKIKVSYQGHFFSVKSSQTINKGWKLVLNESKDDVTNKLPFLKERGPAIYLNAEVESKQTIPLSRYTKDTLIAVIKNASRGVNDAELKKILKDESGIGTEATRGKIIEKLCFRGYIEKNKKKQLVSTEKGRYLISIAPDFCKDPATASLWEQQPDGITSEDGGNLNGFLSGQQELLRDFILLIKKHPNANNKKTQIHTYNLCSGNMIRREGKYGMWWGCCNYPKCKSTLKDCDVQSEEKQNG